MPMHRSSYNRIIALTKFDQNIFAAANDIDAL